MKDAFNITWDLIVVGGGPAGMMAAGRAAERGLKVLLIEKNDTLGKKLLITGGGRCNLTNNQPDVRELLKRFKENDKFLFSAFSQWSVTETLNFFHSRRMDTKVENERRVFPRSEKAQSVWDVLIAYMKEGGVTILPNSPVIGLEKNKNTITGVILKNKKVVKGKNFVLSTGGKSRPETGSTGDGFKWLKELGHKVEEPTTALVPIAVYDAWVKRLQGITLPQVKITVLQNNEKQVVSKGKILFTHFGVSGPTILNLSKDVGELLKYGEVYISLDILPQYDYGQLNTKLQEIFKENSNKKFKNGLGDLVPAAFAPIVVELSGINGDTWNHSVTREKRLKLVKILKDMRMKVFHLLGVEKAIVTSGGVALPEIDFKTMQSRKILNLYLIGDILDIDRPSGGYSLQLCWTTGYVAGNSILKEKE